MWDKKLFPKVRKYKMLWNWYKMLFWLFCFYWFSVKGFFPSISFSMPLKVNLHFDIVNYYWSAAAVYQDNTPNANMVDHSVGAQDELHESEASEALVFCFDNASPEKSCFVDGLVCFISLCLLVFVFLNASRRDRDCPTFASTGKQWIHGIRWDEGSE